MSIHKVTNIFVGNGSALEADASTLTPGKLGLFMDNQLPLAGGYMAASPTEKIQFSQTFADGTFKKSMSVNGRSVVAARSEKYKPATREVWGVGFQRGYVNAAGVAIPSAGTIEVNNSTEYSFVVKFKNDKALYSERPEVLRVSFTSAAAATQLSIATQIAAAINNSSFASQITALVIGDGTGLSGLTAATDFGVEITSKDINQFRTSTYRENRVAFDVFVDDATGFEATPCVQVQANDPGVGTYNSVYNKENFEYQYEGISNRRMFPSQEVKFAANSAGVMSSAITALVATPVTDVFTFAAGELVAGDMVVIDGVANEVKYLMTLTEAVLVKVPATFAVTTVKVGYSIIVIEFTDTHFTTGADAVSNARKSIYIASPGINSGASISTLTPGSSEFVAVRNALHTWLATAPCAIATPVLNLV